ncbi:IMP dehydrogenase [Candidatus Woesearchaeota archaeon]|nr:IMP dehydrogenase [Candidatus Woesearchaeota archaeon]
MVKYIKGSDNVERSIREFVLDTGLITDDNLLPNINLRSKAYRTNDPNNEYVYFNLPMWTAAMQCLVGYKGRFQLMVAMPQRGGIGVIPRSIDIEPAYTIAKQTKDAQGGFQTSLRAVRSDDSLETVINLMRETKYSKFPVVDESGKCLGLLTDDMFDPDKAEGLQVRDVYRGYALVDRTGNLMNGVDILKTEGYVPLAVKKGISLQEAGKIMTRYANGFLLVLDDDAKLWGSTFKKDRDMHVIYLPHETIDQVSKKYRVAAAVSTHKDDHPRIRALLSPELDLDVIILDASHGQSVFQARTLEFIRKINEKIPVIAGNLINQEGTTYILEEGLRVDGHGFAAIKTQMGVGAGCTSTEVHGTGAASFSGTYEPYQARNKFADDHSIYVPLIHDGGIFTAPQISVALTMADTIMMGKFFGRFTESAGDIHPKTGQKEMFYEASPRVKNAQRYQTLVAQFAEGEDGWVPHVGSIHDEGALALTVEMIKTSFMHSGCKNIDEFHANAVLKRQSEIALREHGATGIEVRR